MIKFLKKINLPNQILIGFVVGILSGIFFGERMAALEIVGDGFIRLLQMAVLPFVSFSLIAGLGQMTYKEAGRLARKGLGILLLLWFITFVIIAIMPFAFPEWKSATYFNNSLIPQTDSFDFLDLFIPKNPFHAYANNVVPAVVVFSMAIGVALMGIQKKQGLLNGLTVLNEALIKITNFVVQLAPIGVFAITANAAGTLAIDDVNKIQVYLISYMVFALLATFVFFPLLINIFTPIKYRDVILKNRGLLITALATGNLFIVISLLITRCKDLLITYEVPEDIADQNVGVIIPTAINFPSAGKLMSLSFMSFAGWFSGLDISFAEMPKLLGLGFFTFFGNTVAAFEFLFDFFRIPIDNIQLFMLTDVVISRFGTLVAAMFYIVLSLLTTYSIHKPLQNKPVKQITYAVGSVLILAIAVFGLKFIFTKFYDDNYEGYNNFMGMHLTNEPVESKVLKEATFIPDNPYFGSLESIQQRGYLRVGYYEDALPYAFTNKHGDLVGYDIDLAHALAKDINVTLEFLPIDRKELQFVLDNNIVDLVMCGVLLTTNQNITYSATYSKGTFAFLVPDHERENYSSRKAVQSLDSLKIGVPNIPYYTEKIQNYLPDATFVTMESPRSFLERELELDAYLMTAEAASAWTLLYPSYSVAIPYPDLLSVPIGIAISQNNINFVSFLNTWLELKSYDQTYERLSDYWIYGRVREKETLRWSILDDMLSKRKLSD